jgi:tetratricopeptide (TPR) repeat protein
MHLRHSTLSLLLLAVGSIAHAQPEAPANLTLTPVAREPETRRRPSEAEIASLETAATANPRLRQPHFDLVRALLAAGNLTIAHERAERWREHDAYNLVVVRLLGDIETEQGDLLRARRTYSSIVELLPRDIEARRALATVLKQAGDLAGARAELLAALDLAPTDQRTAFELGDIEHRLGLPEARSRFEMIAVAPDANESLRYPARQRLAQIAARERRDAEAKGDANKAQEATRSIEALKIRGGIDNDIKVFLSWDTDRTDVDLWVTTPSGQKVFYGNKQGHGGEELFDDVTTGYGPESFTARHAAPGQYTVEVNYFGARSGAFKEARGEVIVVLNEGRKQEILHVLPYRLFEQKDTVTVARIAVSKGGV